ncbi:MULTISPECIES: glycosyltransferase family A protein [unclassified Sinorhizobium]|uniref:glycosyltransferase family A protein n=1 Tax=unclassified Sinorhizobium TaxID=2613772 RepID=UPI0035251B8B
MKSVDVVIPNYNYGHYLRDCAGSVLSQGVDRLRVLIIDNASTDDSARIASEIAASDPRIELRLREVNMGPHASFNEGIDWARSDYFLILCSDDFLAPGALGSAIDLMEQRPDVHLTHGATSFLLGDASFEETSAQPAAWQVMDGPSFLKDICRSGRNYISGPTAVVRTSVQKRIGHYNPELTHTDDLEMWLRFGLHGSIAATTRVQAAARVHPFSQSATVSNLRQWSVEFEAAFTSFLTKDGASLPNSAELLQSARRTLSDRAYWSAISLLCRGDPGWRKLFWRALQLRPSATILPPLSYLIYRKDATSLVKSSLSALGRRITRAA